MNRRHFLTTSAALATLALSSPARAFLGIDLGGAADDATGLDLTKLWDAGNDIVKSFNDITPEQEYYIGRSVSAVILSKYHPFNNGSIRNYLTVLGTTLAQGSSRPETFGGYSFQVLDSDEINALSAPSGFIFLTRGLLRCCRTEDALAAVLAHEIAHVAHMHGLLAIQQSRLTSGLTILAQNGASLAGGDLGAVTQAFGGAITDVTTTMIDSGYSRDLEYEADQSALTTLKNVGYDPQAMVDMLQVMHQNLTDDAHGFGHTHPAPEDRIEEVQAILGQYQPPQPPPARATRFMLTMGGV